MSPGLLVRHKQHLSNFIPFSSDAGAAQVALLSVQYP